MLRILVSAFVLIILAGLALAYRNLRLGRSDRRGSARLAWFTGLATLCSGIAASHHVPAVQEISLLGGAVAFAMYVAVEKLLSAGPRIARFSGGVAIVAALVMVLIALSRGAFH